MNDVEMQPSEFDQITRLLALPAHSFFLFGPRGTGKSTLLRQLPCGASPLLVR